MTTTVADPPVANDVAGEKPSTHCTQCNSPLTLDQRLRLVALEVGEVGAGSTNRFGKPAIGISDVENAIRLPLANHGVLTKWHNISMEFLNLGGKEDVWRVRLRCRFSNCDNSENFEDAEWEDIGSTPSAA